MKVYIGERRDGEASVGVGIEGKGFLSPLNPRFDLFNHSPTGFEWGYGGSGPAQLALAMCADCIQDDERALRVYQYFKDSVIAPLDDDTWSLTAVFVRDEIQRLEEAHGLKAPA